jgi:pilus assembly protein CpaB
MSRSAAAIDPGQTNKRFMILAVVLGLIGAVLVYITVSGGGGSSGSASGDQLPVVVAKVDIAARTKITASMVEVKLVPESDRALLAYGEIENVLEQVTRFPIVAGEQVLSNKIVPLSGTTSLASQSLSFVVPDGKRAIAINVSQVVAAGGLVLPGDYVDILVVYDVEIGSGDNAEVLEAFMVDTIMQNIEILAVSQTIVDTVTQRDSTANADGSTTTVSTGGHRARNSESDPDPAAVTVTLALTPQDAQKLFLAESNGTIRLSVRPFGEDGDQPVEPLFEPDLFPRNLPNSFTR